VIYVTFAYRCDQIEDRCIVFGAQQLDIFGMRPDEWQRRAGWTSDKHMLLRDTLGVPYLFRNQGACARKAFHCPNIFISRPPGGNLIVTALSSQQWPKAPDTCAAERIAVRLLPITIMVIPMPARTVWCVYFQRGIVNGQRFQYVCIARAAYPIPDQPEKSSADNFTSWIAPGPIWQILDLHITVIGILDPRFCFFIGRADAYVILGIVLEKRTTCCISPPFDVGRPVIRGVLA